MTPPGEPTDRHSNRGDYVTISPRDFVNPPFIRCPKCCKDSFVVSNIAAHQYSRRCRNCLYPTPPERHERTRLPALDKKVIYLDQFVISNMMYAMNSAAKQHGRGPHEAFYREVFTRLDLLAKQQLLVCPSSEFHDSESLTSRCFEPLKQMYELLSYKVRWHQSDSVRTCQIMEAFQYWVAGQPPQRTEFTKDNFLYGDRSGWTSHFFVPSHTRWEENLVEDIRQTRDTVAEGLRTVFAKWQGDKDKTFDDWVQEETLAAAKNYIHGFRTHLCEVVATQAEIQSTQQVSLNNAATFLAPTHEASVMMRLQHALMDKGCSEGDWMQKAWEFLQSEHFAGLPFVRIGSLIWATVANKIAHSGQKRLPTRGIYNDVGLVATFLPYYDAMFLDKEIQVILGDPHMRDVLAEYGTRIYSLRNREAFLSYLDEIENGASPEHLGLLNEVYGDEYLKPYLDLYNNVLQTDDGQG